MNLTEVLFNRNPVVRVDSIEQPSQLEIKNTFSLWNGSYDDAIRYGGELTREALRKMNLRHDRKNIIVDTKVHMLMPGWSPAILGWHVDGAPRNSHKNPQGAGLPDTYAQEGDDRFNRYHILVTGNGCLTQYINQPIYVPIPSSPSDQVYAVMSDFVQRKTKEEPTLVSDFESCQVYEFDWWNIHTGVIAKQKEWRYLIRVCESDYYEPQQDLRQVIRMQSQIYSPTNFGW
jgi:hypothetical protein